MPKKPEARKPSRRERELAELIRKARENPGVREVMEVYARSEQAVARTRPYLATTERVVDSVSDRTST
jgi:hypothetical protein